MADRTRLNQTPEWTALAKHREELGRGALAEGAEVPGLDTSTQALVATYRELRKK
ncbi:hypothetical protein ACFQ0G_03745 [Streptomyces chiangmaiensis]